MVYAGLPAIRASHNARVMSEGLRSVAANLWLPLVTVIAFAVLLGGCHSGSSGNGIGGMSGGGAPGSGGSSTAAGSGAAGPGSGGAAGSAGFGGAAGEGGTTGLVPAGGTTGSGGPLGSGGPPRAGGATGNGGRTTGGSTSIGGASAGAAGSTKAPGGATGSGGASSGGAGGLGGSKTGVDGGTAEAPYKGVANCTCAERTSLKVSWYYNWTVSPDKCSTGGDFVPMYSNHPNTNPTPQAVSDQISALVKAGYQYVLGFNEPNKSDQANMTVADAIALWPAMTSKTAILVGSPATSADGQSWFKDFWTEVQAQKLRVDFIALHWYGWNSGSCDAKAANLESYIKWAEGLTGNLPIWLTEWGCMNDANPDDATVQAFFEGAVAMFAKHPRLERYAWYQWDPHNYVTNSDHSLTPLGTVYASEPSTR